MSHIAEHEFRELGGKDVLAQAVGGQLAKRTFQVVVGLTELNARYAWRVMIRLVVVRCLYIKVVTVELKTGMTFVFVVMGKGQRLAQAKKSE